MGALANHQCFSIILDEGPSSDFKMTFSCTLRPGCGESSPLIYCIWYPKSVKELSSPVAFYHSITACDIDEHPNK